MNQATKPNILRLEPNVPVEIALKFTDGITVNGQYGQQIMFTLTDGRRWYAPPIVAQQIKTFEIQPGESFDLIKKQNGRKTEYVVSLKPVSRNDEPVSCTQLASALRTAVSAAHQAERYATEIGYTVRFSEESIRAMANTLIIGMGHG